MTAAASRHLMIFAKAPRLGRVKTRLARDVGDVAAWRFYRGCLMSLVNEIGRDPRWRTVIAAAPDVALIDGTPWPRAGKGVALAAQGPGDLGRRMQRAFDLLPPGPAVIVGADIPGVRRRHIRDAFRALGAHDAVFGPADDGGYWLVGLKRTPRVRQIFDGIRWSGPHALADTLGNLKGARVAMLESLIDVDDGADLARWSASRR